MDEKKTTYVYNDEMYDFDYIITQGNGRCQPNGVSGIRSKNSMPLKFGSWVDGTDELANRHTSGASHSYKHSLQCCS